MRARASLKRRGEHALTHRDVVQTAAFVLHRRREQHTILPLNGMTAVRQSVFLLTISAALALSAGTADAVTCYMLFDRFDNVVYRNTVSPIALSARGGAGTGA